MSCSLDFKGPEISQAMISPPSPPPPPRYNARRETLPLGPPLGLSHSKHKERPVLRPSKLVKSISRQHDGWLPDDLKVQDVIDLPTIKSSRDRIIFLSSDGAKFFESPSNEDARLQLNLSERYQIPDLFWSPIMNEATGCFGDNLTLGNKDHPTTYSTWFRFMIKQVQDLEDNSDLANAPIQYDWDKIAVYTISRASHHVVLCFDVPPSAQEEIQKKLQDQREGSLDPYQLHPVIIKSILQLFDNSVWSLRHLIRRYEKSRSVYNSKTPPEPHFHQLHDISRHIIHSCETLKSASNILQRMIEQHGETTSELVPLPIATNPSSEPQIPPQISIDAANHPSSELQRQKSDHRKTASALKFQMTMLNCIELRSKALEERLKNEINLAFNAVALYNSQTSVRISEAALADSASVRTISVLGLVFLPGTFICSVFSTTFFNFSPASDGEPQAWVISDKFWVFWAVTVPLTIAVILCWVLWIKGDKKLKWKRS